MPCRGDRSIQGRHSSRKLQRGVEIRRRVRKGRDGKGRGLQGGFSEDSDNILINLLVRTDGLRELQQLWQGVEMSEGAGVASVHWSWKRIACSLGAGRGSAGAGCGRRRRRHGCTFLEAAGGLGWVSCERLKPRRACTGTERLTSVCPGLWMIAACGWTHHWISSRSGVNRSGRMRMALLHGPEGQTGGQVAICCGEGPRWGHAGAR